MASGLLAYFSVASLDGGYAMPIAVQYFLSFMILFFSICTSSFLTSSRMSSFNSSNFIVALNKH
ncbi:hypothetical protein D3C84_1283100 [compost metagenome]